VDGPRPYPVRIEGQLDTGLSRWVWLVKWFLAIPHYIVLTLVWLTLLVLTIVAFFAILFTGRYPRGMFDFNVGVLRWTWRVAVYSYGALGSDRYPPFTLDDVPDYSARLEVAYPEQLSRRLVLVKWWLLAIPQYLVTESFWEDCPAAFALWIAQHMGGRASGVRAGRAGARRRTGLRSRATTSRSAGRRAVFDELERALTLRLRPGA
jgi:hypothetical protein